MRRLKICSVVLSCSEASLFFGDDLLRLWLQSVQYDLQHDFAWVTDEAYCSVVLALLLVAFLGKASLSVNIVPGALLEVGNVIKGMQTATACFVTMSLGAMLLYILKLKSA